MSSDWVVKRLGDLAEIRHGWPFKSEFFSEDLTGGPIVVAIGNFEYTGGFRFDSTRIKEYRDVYPVAYDLRPGEILLAMTCQTPDGEILGIPARVPDDGRRYLHNQRLGKVVLREANVASPDFLYFLFRSKPFNQHLVSSASGTKILHTAPNRIESFEFRLPPLAEQRRIAAVLGALDDKIELNRQMNRTLEEMAQALFKSWFIDFDGHTDLVESDLGPIPSGWSTGNLLDLAALNPESWGSRNRPAVLRYVDLANTKRGLIESVSEFARDDAPSRAQRVLRSGDTIVGTVRPGNGSYALVSEDGLTGSTGFAALRPLKPENAAFVYLAATRQENIDRLAHLADGGAYPAVRPDVVAQTPVAIPPGELLARFSEVVDPMVQRIELNVQQSRTLTALRDLLLPRLISGQLRVPESLDQALEALSAEVNP